MVQSISLRNGFFGLWLLLLVLCLGLGSAVAQPAATTYRVQITAGVPPQARVEADLVTEDGRLTMATGGGIDHLPDQWATFIRHLQVTGAAGQPLAATLQGPEGWRLAGGYRGAVRLVYEVDLSFTREAWPPGNEQAGLYQDGALYLVTKPLFITSETAGPRQVTFEIPAGWEVATPWAPAAEAKHTFLAESREDLTENSIVLGQFAAYRFQAGPFTLSLALLGPIQESAEIVAATLKAGVEQAGLLFDQTVPSRYLMTFFYAEQDDGEAFVRSAAFTTRTRPTEENRVLWGNMLVHELFHFWLGEQVRSAESADGQWLTEGFTDYLADLVLVRSGLINETRFLQKMEKVLARYLYFKASPAFPEVSLVEAGTRKGTYRFGVYDGGWAVAYCLDVLIQKETNGARSLYDFLRRLYEAFGKTGRPFTYPDVVALAGETAGTDLSAFFEAYVNGVERLPLETCLAQAGLDASIQAYAGEMWIHKKANLTPRQQAVYRHLIRGR